MDGGGTSLAEGLVELLFKVFSPPPLVRAGRERFLLTPPRDDIEEGVDMMVSNTFCVCVCSVNRIRMFVSLLACWFLLISVPFSFPLLSLIVSLLLFSSSDSLLFKLASNKNTTNTIWP